MTGWQHVAGEEALHLDTIRRADKLIEPYIVNTPVLQSTALNQLAGAELWFKCENLQRTGAFKFRGACHALLNLTHEQRRQGVFTVSSGNHGAALACAGQMLGVPVHVAVPHNAPSIKKQNIARYQAQVTEIAPGMEAREAFITKMLETTSSHFIPPYDHPLIIAGQATAALELIKLHPDLDCLITPVGGGGLLAGTCMVGHSQELAVYGAEPETVNDAWESLRSGKIEAAKGPHSICDGLLTRLGEHTFPIIRSHVQEILLVSEDEIIAAMGLLWQELKTLVEPSSATVMAAVLKYPGLFKGRKIGIIISGGNVDIARLPLRDLFHET